MSSLLRPRSVLEALMAALLVMIAAGACVPALLSPGPGGGGNESDVACLTPSAWPSDTRHFAHRSEFDGGDVRLFTTQTSEQFHEDDDRDFVPHQAVYRYDPDSETFAIVDDSVWDEAQGAVNGICPSLADQGSFQIDGGRLYFNGERVSVAGGTAVDILDPLIAMDVDAPPDTDFVNVVAVLSTDGRVSPVFGTSTGQHYHQLFSKVDGSPVGPALRIAITYPDPSRVIACWTTDQRYVIYRHGTDAVPRAGRFCVVPVADVLAELEDE